MKVLENNFLRVEIADKGAELQSLKDKSTNREWLWQGDSKWWGKRAPVLFPFVGALNNGQYHHEGKTYAMSKHGFARDMVFQKTSEGDCWVVYKLSANEETLKSYPFQFELLIRYELEGSNLKVQHEVRNLGEEPMYFSLGGHPAFNCPMDEEHWELDFECAEALESYCIDLEKGLILPHKKSLPSDGKPLVLKSALFEEDALVFEHLNSAAVTLRGPKPEEQLNFSFENFPLFALWSPKGPFLCLEPWFGMADWTTSSGELRDKYGVVELGAAETFECAYRMSLGLS